MGASSLVLHLNEDSCNVLCNIVDMSLESCGLKKQSVHQWFQDWTTLVVKGFISGKMRIKLMLSNSIALEENPHSARL